MTMKSKEFKVPHVFVLLFIMIIVAVIMTYFVPAGQFARIKSATGGTMVDPNSFKYVAQNPVSFWAIPDFIVNALVASSATIWMTVMSAASAEVALATGAFDVGIKIMINKFKKNQLTLLLGTIILFGIYGCRQNPVSMVGFVPVLVLFCRMCGYDALTGVAIIVVGAGCCQGVGPVAPATTMVAQSIAELPIFSGIGFRLATCAVLLTVSAVYILRYAKKVQNDPSASIVADLEMQWRKETTALEMSGEETPTITVSQILVIISFLACVLVQVYGGIKLGWGNRQTAAQFIYMALICGFCGKMSPTEIAKAFGKGASKMMVAGLMIGIASSISRILAAGKIIDTIVLGIATTLNYAPLLLQAPIMFIANIIINVFMPSGSGQAAAVMPLFIPVSDLIGMTRQTCVFAFNLGDGLGNYVLPHSSALMANLMVAGISYGRWIKFFKNLFGIWCVISIVACMIAQFIGYGPF